DLMRARDPWRRDKICSFPPHCPENIRELSGDGHDRFSSSSFLYDRQAPSLQCRAPVRAQQGIRRRPEDESRLAVALLGYSAALLGGSGLVKRRNESEISSNLPTRSEARRIANCVDEGRGDDGTDAIDGLKPTHDGIGAGDGVDRLVGVA